MIIKKVFLYFFLSCLQTLNAQEFSIIEWHIADLLLSEADSIYIEGTPALVVDNEVRAVRFNGINDGIFINSNPLSGVQSFKLSVLFNPDSSGNYEQRFLHFGEPRGDRILLEIRLIKNQWALDVYLKSGAYSVTLLDTTNLFPTNKWYKIDLHVDSTMVKAFINKNIVYSSNFPYVPMNSGKTSIGVRLNKQYWFCGSIASLKIYTNH